MCATRTFLGFPGICFGDEACAKTEVNTLPRAFASDRIFVREGSHNSFFGRPQESSIGCEEMTEIKFCGGTYRGTAEGAHGVFTNSNGAVYAGKIAYGSVCVGVATRTDGTTQFVECDADGLPHGRVLHCQAGGGTGYERRKHGRVKEFALLYADGTCRYNGNPCRADYLPFVQLQAKVLPIKARPPLVPPTASFLYAAFFSPPPPPSQSNRPRFGTRRSWRRPTATRCAPASSAISLRGACVTATATQMHRASNLDDAPAEGCTTHAPRPHA